MRLEWVRRRLEAWAAWVEESKRGRVASPKMDGMPHAAAADVPVPDGHEEEKLTQRALVALHALYPAYSETISLVYVVGPAAHVVEVVALAEWIGVTEKALFMRIERAESKFSEMLEKTRDAQDLGL
nr:MAG TPA: antitermination protein Q [Caudoviricetes sp.]